MKRRDDGRVRVFIVDDSPLARLAIKRTLSHDPAFEVAGEARDGVQALRDVPRTRPDVVLMDVTMPQLDGIETTAALMSRDARPTLIVSDLVGVDAALNFRALEAGALDLVPKPTLEEIQDERRGRTWLRRVRLLAGVPVITRRGSGARAAAASPPPLETARRERAVSLVAVGASTGGPPAIHELLRGLGPQRPWPVLIVQHIVPGFAAGFARWLSETTGTPVRLAADGEEPRSGVAYVAPDGAHLTVRESRLGLEKSPPERGHRPSVDVLFGSIARSGWARNTAAVLLTGMGDDGARGLGALRAAGAWTVAQDEKSSVVYGMPRVAAEAGAACEVLALQQIAPRVLQLGRPERTPDATAVDVPAPGTRHSRGGVL